MILLVAAGVWGNLLHRRRWDERTRSLRAVHLAAAHASTIGVGAMMGPCLIVRDAKKKAYEYEVGK
jgi:hypothetical protein